jgi:hypothetical protein
VDVVRKVVDLIKDRGKALQKAVVASASQVCHVGWKQQKEVCGTPVSDILNW